MFVPEVAQKFRANAWFGAGLKFVIHIREKQDHKTTGQQDYNEKIRTALDRQRSEDSRLRRRLRRDRAKSEEQTEFRDGTTDDGPQDDAEKHRTPNAEYDSVAGSEGQRREWDNNITDHGMSARSASLSVLSYQLIGRNGVPDQR